MQHRLPPRFTGALTLALALALIAVCPARAPAESLAHRPAPTPAASAETAPPTETAQDDYPWLADAETPLPPWQHLHEHFPPPRGFARIHAEPGSYAAWLRKLPIRTDRNIVLAFDGSELSRPSAAVLLLDVGDRDLMQCADSIIRLHAEYLWSQGRADRAAYRFTSGDRSAWADWRGGEHFVITRSKVRRVAGSPRPNTHASFRRWLDLIFTYAGTSSLARHTPAPHREVPIEAGDFFVDPGFPGHAVIVLDIAEDDHGQRLALLAQGFMPAEEVHILASDGATDGEWFRLPEGSTGRLDTPSWAPFEQSARRRFP